MTQNNVPLLVLSGLLAGIILAFAVMAVAPHNLTGTIGLIHQYSLYCSRKWLQVPAIWRSSLQLRMPGLFSGPTPKVVIRPCS